MVLGLPFDVLTEEQALADLYEAIESRTQCFLSTPNLNFAIAARADNEFRKSVFESHMSVADGMPLVLLAKLIGANLPGRVAGSSLFERMREQTSAEPVSVFFFGGMGDVADRAVEVLNSSSSGMRAVGSLNPGVGSVADMSTDDIIERINAANPDFIVVSLGAKKGQQWIAQNRRRLNATVISHLGAVVNFVAGAVERAPEIWQKLGAEWLWRILEEPTLWKRYLFDGCSLLRHVFSRVLPLAIYGRVLESKHSNSSFVFSTTERDQQIHIRLSGNASRSQLVKLREELARLVALEKDLVLSFDELMYADSYFWALIIKLNTELRARGNNLVIKDLSKPITRLAYLNMVDEALGI